MTGCASDSKTRLIRLGHGLDVTHSVHQAMVKADGYLNDLSEGKMRLQIYPNQQLGSERECLELLQIGSLDMTKVSGAVMENLLQTCAFSDCLFYLMTKNTCSEF